ncbi:baseplate wedge subunit [uncultured Caudovirales phage]|uniref:Baseplate wedge subunit n=1 Tax=uncultured Caudovirales phage TaxID=2100421 RepID=A0A6J5L2H4_9CAUD|nr:baseplate wedge subunit [uncultured Caudovirales phage]
MASKKINYTELDFDGIKYNLKEFMKGQTTFQDYDFDGSGLSVLLDVLTYNTMYNGVYNNLSINEMFLDSARKRNSVVSRSKELGYRPQSAICATATIDITLTSGTPTTFNVPANTPFLSTINGVTYTFYNSSPLSYNTPSVAHTFQDVVLTEKSNILSFNYTVADGIRYIIPNINVDLNTLMVSIQDSISSSILTTFNLADSIVDVTPTSTVYWIKEIDNGLYELTFGNDIIGKALINGNIVKLNYCVSSLDAPNGANLFTYGGTLNTGITVSLLTKSSAANGTAPEDIESIRFNAPRAYSAQNRGVTTNDYKSLIFANFPSAKSVSVWGGEDNIPPIYGKTFICIKPKNTDVLTSSQKDNILNTILPSKNMLTVRPVLVDPESIDILIDTTIYYNSLLTTRSSDDIKQLVIGTILNYNTNELQRFDGVFRYSKLSKLIDNSENSIINNITKITLKRYIIPKYNISANYTINLINPIYYSGAAEDIILSSGFYITGSNDIHYIVDNGLGNMILFTLDANNIRIVVNSNIGTVNYEKGLISIIGLNINSIIGNNLTLFIKPSSNDVVSALTQIAQISIEDLKVTIISDTTSTGDLRAGQNYIFTSSRI